MKLTINKLSFNYAATSILKDIELEVGLGEVLSIVGPNGSGKSTLLKCINRILKTKQNTILIDGQDASKLNLKELSKLMGYVPQSSTSTFPFTVFDVVLMGRKPYIHWNIGEHDNEIVAQMLDFWVSVTWQCVTSLNSVEANSRKSSLAALWLSSHSLCFLMNRPVRLDIKHQLEILCMLKSLTQSKERSVIVSMHDLNLASRFSDRMLMLKQGCIYALVPLKRC